LAPRPNIIVILCDDLGYGDVGVLFQNRLRVEHPDRPSMRTPHLDRMAAQGLVLDGLYCPSPVCAPSRASLLTGTTQGHADLRDNGFDRELEDRPTLASVLRAAGYATSAVGKWGLQGGGPEASTPAAWPGYPTRRGFDEYYGYVRHVDGHEHYPREGPYRGPKEVWHDDHEVSTGLDCCYTTDLFTARAKHWITEHQSRMPEQPFFVYLALDTPHAVTELPPCAYPDGGGLDGGMQWLGEPGRMISTAHGVPDSWYHPDYADAVVAGMGSAPWPDVYRRYATAVRRIDDAVGDLLMLLGDLEIDDQTLVLFTSDNGPSIESYLDEDLEADFFASYGPFDGIKRDCWEGGVRVGGIVRAPGLVAAGSRSDSPAQLHDLMPTFAELAGLSPPARTDGVSLLPLLTGEGEQPPSRVYVEYAVTGQTPDYADFAPAHRGRIRGQMQLARISGHVGVRYDVQHASDPFEIYDVLVDPQQLVDLASERADLQVAFHTACARMRVPHPEFPRPYDGVLVPALEPEVPAIVGEWRTFHGDFDWVPMLDGCSPDRVSAAAWPDGEPLVAGAARWAGEIVIPHAGLWELTVTGCADAVLKVHDALVVESRPQAVSMSGTIRLAAGRHPVRLYALGAERPDVTRRSIAE